MARLSAAKFRRRGHSTTGSLPKLPPDAVRVGDSEYVGPFESDSLLLDCLLSPLSLQRDAPVSLAGRLALLWPVATRRRCQLETRPSHTDQLVWRAWWRLFLGHLTCSSGGNRRRRHAPSRPQTRMATMSLSMLARLSSWQVLAREPKHPKRAAHWLAARLSETVGLGSLEMRVGAWGV